METLAHNELMRATSADIAEHTIGTTENKLHVGLLEAVQAAGDSGRPLFYSADSIIYWLYHSSQSRVSDFSQ